MDFLYFITSINKLSLLAFVITVGFVAYEFFLLRKEKKSSGNVNIPKFDGGSVVTPNAGAATSPATNTSVSKHKNYIFIAVLILLLMIFGVLTVLGSMNFVGRKNVSSASYQTPLITYSTSKGIKILDNKFQPVSDQALSKFHLGDKLIIGIETIKDIDIDMARIRVNKDSWSPEDATSRFDKTNNIFYINYMVATGTAYLKVSGELHSKTQGWLSD